MFHYYRYRQDDGSLISSSPHGRGRAIDNSPAVSVLLEPRSLVITTGSLYTSHLNGIDDLTEDVLPAPINGPRIANADLLGGSQARDFVFNGGVLQRKTRYSLTCRDVERVATSVPFLAR